MGTVTLLCILGGSLLISDCYGFSSRAQLHRQTRQAGVGPTRGSCPHLLKLFQGRATPEETEKDRIATQRIKTAQLLQKQGKSSAAIRLEISSCSPVTVTCDPSAKYRTADGSCNNLDNPEWGQAGTAQARLVNASYDDGISDPRSRSVAPGVTLPRVRRISNGVHAAGGRLRRSQTLTLQVFQMGQFLDHDIIATPVQSVVQDCCGTDGLIELTNQMVQTKELVLARLRHEVCNGGGAKGQCLELDIEHETARSMEVSLDQLNAVVSLANCNSIVIGAGDARFREGYCMPFRRSAPLFCAEESIQREQRNDVTSFIDASNVYGSSLAEQAALRDDALLRIEEGNRLPNNVDDEACLSDQNRGIFCSLAGDARVNVIPSLIAYHTLFVREHNRIASLLMQAYPNEETVFQETKKIITAEMQKIIYDEFLPSFLSDSAMEEYGLRNSATYSYDVNLNPTITNGFGIAFRVGHSWIPRTMEIFNRNLRRVQRINTENTFLRPDLTYRSGNPPPHGLEGLAYWLSGDPSPGTDRIIEDAARNRLFLDENGDALDLVSFNIQRGRDHGLPAYNTYREFCNLPSVPAEWSQLNGGNLVDHDSDSTRRLRDVYESPLDIDLFTGALTETPVDTGDVGRTLDCILGEQFRRLKYGDRFWYQSETAGFSAEQLEEINKVTMSRILCDNYNFGQIHRNAFLSTDLVDCSSIQHMNMTKFGASDIPPTQAPQPPPGGGSDGQRPPPGGGGGGGGQRPPAGGGGGGGGGGGQRPPPGAGGGGGQRPRPGRGEGRREGGGRG